MSNSEFLGSRVVITKSMFLTLIVIVVVGIMILVSWFFVRLELRWGLLSFVYELLESFISWIGTVTLESIVYFTTVVPSAFSLLIIRFAITNRHNKIEENSEWKEVETLLKSMDPCLNLIALIADVAGFFVALTYLSTNVSGFVVLAFILSLITISLTFANWCLNGIVFKHHEFLVRQEKFLLVEKNSHRCMSWAVLNSVMILFVWVLWDIMVIGILSIL